MDLNIVSISQRAADEVARLLLKKFQQQLQFSG